jgi:hypothetical protein
MKIQKFIDIQQEVEITITAEDIAVILDEPQVDEEETQRLIHSNLATCINYLTTLTDKRIAKISSGAKQVVVKKLTETIIRLKV